MTGIGWLIVLALIGFFVLVTLRMVPSYLEYYKVVSTLESLEKESGFSSTAEIRQALERKFNISFVEVITPRDVRIRPFGKNFNVGAKYESRVHLLGNVYIVMAFDKQVTTPRL
jgi:hypothetical protein